MDDEKKKVSGWVCFIIGACVMFLIMLTLHFRILPAVGVVDIFEGDGFLAVRISKDGFDRIEILPNSFDRTRCVSFDSYLNWAYGSDWVAKRSKQTEIWELVGWYGSLEEKDEVDPGAYGLDPDREKSGDKMFDHFLP